MDSNGNWHPHRDREEASAARRWALVLAHREQIDRIVRARLAEPLDVEDCVQEALVRTVCFADLDESRVGAFLTTTAIRLCFDHYRRRRRQDRVAARAAGSAFIPGPEDQVCDRHLGGWLIAQVERLPFRERQVMLARANGMSVVEAANRFRISKKAAEGAFSRGRARLRLLIEAET